MSLSQGIFHCFLRNEILQDLLHESSIKAGKAAIDSILSITRKMLVCIAIKGIQVTLVTNFLPSSISEGIDSLYLDSFRV